PTQKAPAIIYAGEIATATYQVTNNTPFTLNANGLRRLPQGIVQSGGTCAQPFNLAPKASCTITLQITADYLIGDVRGGPEVCNTVTNPIYCSLPTSGQELNIKKSNTFPPSESSYTVGGTISGLTSTGLILQNNGTDALYIPAGATSFTFPTAIPAGGAYYVTASSQPAGLTCTVSNNEGININHDITDIKVVCSAITYTVGGTISGLSANGLVLQNNGVDNLSLTSGDTTFTFNTPVAAGSDYNVTVLTQPTGLTCTVSNGYGTNVNANITNISIVCSATTYTISGTISNLTTSGLVLQNNESDDLAIPAGSTNFTFPTPVALGGGYNVTIAQQPLNSFCTVTNGTGTNVNANVNNVQLQCYSAGDAFGGGAIYQITANTVYVISLTDVPTTNTLLTWSTVYTNMATTDDDGDLNTYIILAGSNFPAAEACRNYDSANHWFLPSRAQYATIGTKAALTALYSKAATTGFIGFALNTGYYSSTQGNLILAFVRFFTPPTPPDSGEGLLNKVTRVPVRCVRAIPY
ncbi:MAG TPA: hypothetical protein PK657_07835, partial [Legionella sp.]|nr:hypothetical protein [Legionella sp.]